MKVCYKGKYYGLFLIKHDIPLVFDYDDYLTIRSLDKEWLLDDKGDIYCMHTHNGVSKQIYLHNVIMTIMYTTLEDKPIEHINTYKIDHRRCNLRYKIKNYVKKKHRTGMFDDLPTFIYYIKCEDRFMVRIGNHIWKTTSNKQVSITEKLNEAKQYLNELRNNQPELFINHNMNGDVNSIDLYVSLYKIIKRAGYDYEIIIPSLKTDKLLKTKSNKQLVFDKKRRLNEIIFDNITLNDLPTHVYYKKEDSISGAYFYIKTKDMYWATKSDRNIDIKEKYNMLLEKLANL